MLRRFCHAAGRLLHLSIYGLRVIKKKKRKKRKKKKKKRKKEEEEEEEEEEEGGDEGSLVQTKVD